MEQIQFRQYQVATAQPLSEQQLEQVISLFDREHGIGGGVLGGRGVVTVGDVDGLGAVVIKHYTRGGLVGKLIRSYYLRSGAPRSLREFEVMGQALQCGVNAPQPLLAIWQGAWFYRAWLVTRRIENQGSLAELSQKHEAQLHLVMPEVVRQVRKLVRARVYHVDLHPGNVIFDFEGRVFILDFDRAKNFRGSLNRLRDLYLCRWRRAIIKHGLPEVLIELFSAGMRIDFDE